MTVATKFHSFCEEIKIEPKVVENIAYRYKRITKQLNTDYWTTDSETSHSLYVGSYGRDTDIKYSDVDMLFVLPYSVYERINGYSGNKQSALLSEVRSSIEETYSTTHISGDGQVVKIDFEDGVSFEVLPCFTNKNESYTYPDTNNGGSWKVTNPKAEIEEIRNENNESNGNLKNLCRMIRAWKYEWDVPMGGLLIDTLCYQFMLNWKNKDKSYLYYDLMTRDFFDNLRNKNPKQDFWLAPGSSQYVYRKGPFEYKATQCFNLASQATENESDQMPYSANEKWKKIFGSKFKG